MGEHIDGALKTAAQVRSAACLDMANITGDPVEIAGVHVHQG